MSRTASSPPAEDFVPFATAALDFHRTLNLTPGPLATTRAELNTLHEHLVAVYELLDAHTLRTSDLMPIERAHLHTARVRIWQATTEIHSAYHSAPRPGTGKVPDREAYRTRRPDGAPELTICARHQTATRHVRRHTTPADLHDPFTSLIRH